MLHYVSGNLFESPAQTWVNTVNTVGVMGKGIALQFKKIFPEMFREYQTLCDSGQLRIGTLFVWRGENKVVLNFPTKEHWRNPSRLEYIEAGLQTFVRSYERAGIHSIAFPPLGCGNGELEFRVVRPLMQRYLEPLPITTYIYAPHARNAPPEHRTPAEIAAWLQENPSDYPFSAVWEDILNLLAAGPEFETLTRAGRFTAELTEDREGIRFRSPGRTTKVHREELHELWQQLRGHGILTSAYVPVARQNVASYMFALLAQLPYVGVVPLSDDFRDLHTSPLRGLHLVPSGRPRADQSELVFA